MNRRDFMIGSAASVAMLSVPNLLMAQGTPDLSGWKTKLDAWFADKEPEMLALIERLVNMDSFSHDAADVNKVGEVVCAWMAQAGFHTAKLPRKPAPADEQWIASLGNVFTARTHPVEAGPGIAFIAHLDTVFPAGTAAARPFKLDRAADRAYGPGIIDMKSGLVQNMFVARALKELKLIDIPMTLTFTADEELGSPSGTQVLGEQLNGAYAALSTEPGYIGGGFSHKRKGSGHMLLEVKGISAHAGRRYEDGASAILEMAQKILAFDKYLDLPNDVTVNTGLVGGGASANSVPPNAWARIHLTYPDMKTGQKLVANLKAEAAKSYNPRTSSHLSGGIRLPPLVPDAKVMKLAELVIEAGKALGYPVHTEASKGAAESGFCYSVLGLPTVCSMGPEGAKLHAPDEFLVPSSLIPRSKLLALSALMASKSFSAAPKVTL